MPLILATLIIIANRPKRSTKTLSIVTLRIMTLRMRTLTILTLSIT